MTIFVCRPARLAAAVLLVLACGLPATAVAAVPADDGMVQARMLDARVNLKQSYFNATAARGNALSSANDAARAQSPALNAAADVFLRTHPGARLEFSPLTGAPTSVAGTRAPLTGPGGSRSNEDIVRDFLQSQRALYGLSTADLGDLAVLGDSPGGASGLRMLRLEQRVGGRPVFQSETRFLLDREGRLVKTTGQFVPAARERVAAFAADALIPAAEAVVKLLASSGKTATAASFVVQSSQDGQVRLSESDGHVAGEVSAREILFPLAPGLLVPAWSLVVFTEGKQDWYAVVDAQTGDLLWRKNIRDDASTHDARFRVYVQPDGVTPADSPAPQSPTPAVPGGLTQFGEIAPTIVGMHTAMNAVASPNGWIDDCPGGICTANESQTLGNNVLACLDRAAPANTCDTDANSVLDGNGRPTGNPDANSRNRDFLGTAPRDFQTNFLPPPQGGAGSGEIGQTATGTGVAPSVFRRGALTQLFYVSNWYHDRLFSLGFDEASANFQQTNFSGMGLGGDRVAADAQDIAGTNNANFATPPDGVSGRMQMFRFIGPTIDRDGGLDTEIAIHELTHGTSNRLVGNAAGLNWDVAAGMGEGWSDFYALSLLNATNADDPNASYASGSYATYKLIAGYEDNYVYGIRRFPYSTNNSINPLTWADVDDVTNDMSGGIASSPVDFNGNGGMEVHNSGEIWALSLWEMRSRIIADPDGANGNVPTGNESALRLVTDGLKMTPIDPTFVQARDALFDADCATNACANERWIWEGFADRGLGFGADAPYHAVFGFTAGHMALRESFVLPHLAVLDASTDVVVDDSASNNDGALDPGEAVRLEVTLSNPWRAASRGVSDATATLTSSTPGVTIYDGTSAYPAIAPMASATGDSFVVGLDPWVPCGSTIEFTLSTTSELGAGSTTFRMRVGTNAGPGAVITYTRDTTPDLAIPDNAPRGVVDSLAITDDLEIADLDLRIDSLTHTFPGDLSVMLRSPDGLGVDMVSLIGALVSAGNGDNITNMVVDDDLPATAANDMAQAADAAAPYTRSWVPIFNAPWSPAGIGATPDPVGNLSRFDGRGTAGTWTLTVSDQAAADAGTLNQWSLLVTPVNRTCAAAGAAPVITATKTVGGTFRVGGAVTYTVVLANGGAANQGDNPGDEFVDVLPGGLSLVSASATSGTATANVGTNTVSWNGPIAPLGGSVTITITATVDSGTLGSTIANQGTANVDGDGNGSNESTVLTDDPGLPGASDPTVFAVEFAALSASKTVAGTFMAGGAVTYTLTLANSGSAAVADNAGDELTDTLPSGLTLVSASATSGTAIANVGTDTVTWNGAIPPAGSVTLTVNATVDAGASGTLSNQASLSFDADLDGTNETGGLSDDPGVGGASDTTDFVVLQGNLTISPTGLNFGNQPVGVPSAAQTVTLGNDGDAPLEVTTVDATASPFVRSGGDCPVAPFPLSIGASCTLDYSFLPTATGAANQVLNVAADAPGGGTITLDGNGTEGNLTVAPPAIDFGDQPVGSATAAVAVTLGNSGDASLQITAIDAAAAPFARSGGDCPAATPFALAPAASCTLLYTFTPSTAGAASQNLAVATDTTDTGSIALDGNGTEGNLTVTPAAVDFGNQPVGDASAAQTVTLANDGDAALQVTVLDAPAAPFARSGGDCPAAVPFPLAAGASCTVDYSFTPNAAGPANQVLAVAGDAAGGGNIALTGNGTEGALGIGGGTIDFGEQPVDSTSAVSIVTLSNTGDADIEITAIAAASAPFARVAGGSCAAATPFTLTAGSDCTLHYSFTPTAPGAAAQTLAVTSDAGAGSIELAGIGTQAIATLSADALAFGQVAPGDTEQDSVTLSNTGDAPLTVSAISAPDAPFSADGGTCGNVPITLDPGESCTLTYAFAPTADGSYTSVVTLATNGGALQLTLGGTATAPGTPFVEPMVIPTLSSWGTLLLAALLSLIAFAAVRRQMP